MLSVLVLKAGPHLKARCIDKLWLLLVLKNPRIPSQGAVANQRLLLFQVVFLVKSRTCPTSPPEANHSLCIRGEDIVQWLNSCS